MLLLEKDNFSDQAMGIIGKVLGPGVDLVARFTPGQVRETLTSVLDTALAKAFDTVLLSVDRRGDGLTGLNWLDRSLSSKWIDRAAATVSGALGGSGGIATTIIEMPITTAFLMRAIAQIAVREGEDLNSDEGKLQCLQIFALGSPTSGELDGGYYAMRVGLAEFLPKMVEKPLSELLPKLIFKIAERFQVSVATKLSAQSIPAIGAVTGAAINLAFITHFEDRARGHFTVRRLERKYGVGAVRTAYQGERDAWLAQKAARRRRPRKSELQG